MIYPVKIRTWFCNKHSPFYEDLEYLKIKLPDLKCNVCSKPITLDLGYVSHGFAYGYQNDNFCSLKCLQESAKLIKKTKK